jgi:hypothetical protein
VFLWGVWKGWGWAIDGREAAIQRALAARDTYWQQTIDKANMDHENELREAIKEARAVAPIRNNAELIRMCRDATGGTDCREKSDNDGM